MPALLSQLIAPLAAAVSFAALIFTPLFINARFRKLAGEIRRQGQSDHSLLSSAVADLQDEIASFGDRLAKLEAEPHECLAQNPASIRAGMNLNRRTQALRHYRLGQGPAEIARVLEMPKAEVDLLVKVQAIVARTMGT